MTHEEQLKVNGSGLFFFRSSLSDQRKIEILNFFNAMPEDAQEMIKDLRHEAAEEAEFFNVPD